jgi:hypothetical protein
MFNLCSPGAQVEFNVTFIMPFQRTEAAQQYEFDLGIYAGAGLVGRTRVILENPALAVADFYRYYNGSSGLVTDGQAPGQAPLCAPGTHVVWGNFSYSAICPSDGAGDYSQIRFCATAYGTADGGFDMMTPVTAADTPFTGPGVQPAGGCAPGEVLLGVATANTNPSSAAGTSGFASGGTINTCPATGAAAMGYSCSPAGVTAANVAPAAAWTTCTGMTTQATCNAAAPAGWAPKCNWAVQSGFNVGTILAANGIGDNAGVASDTYLRIRMEFDPSTPGDVVAPFLTQWNLDVDCIPSE